MNKYCMTCSFYSKASDINGICFAIGGMDEKKVLILDKLDILRKVSRLDQTVYSPIVVPNLFGCIYHKEKLNND